MIPPNANLSESLVFYATVAATSKMLPFSQRLAPDVEQFFVPIGTLP
jgi:hypothetical protein